MAYEVATRTGTDSTQNNDGERKIGTYPTEQYAEGWKTFAGKEMEPGPLTDLVGEFGREMTLGTFDAKKLSEMMKAVGKTDNKSVSDRIAGINKALARENLELNISVGADGQISNLELRDRFKPDQWRVGLKLDSEGHAKPSNVRISLDSPDGPIENRPISLSEASLLLAKKSSPLSCP